jgi:hypothetical protein
MTPSCVEAGLMENWTAGMLALAQGKRVNIIIIKSIYML